MKRRFLVLTLSIVLISTFFTMSSATLSNPPVARAAGCTTTSGSFPANNNGNLQPPIYFTVGGKVSVPTNPGDKVSATWPGPITITPSGGSTVVSFGSTIGFSTIVPYSITVCPAGGGASFTGGTAGYFGPLYYDGRLNDRDGQETAAVYCMGDGSVRVYVIGSPWFISFTASPADIAKISKHPSHNTRIISGPGASLSRQSDGSLLVTSPGLNLKDGDYHFTFSDCGILIGL